LTLIGVKRIVPGGIPTKWRSFVVSDSSKIPAGGPKWIVKPAEIRCPGYDLSRITSTAV
jgi:hypothetical protein